MTQQQLDQHALFAKVCEALAKVRYGEITLKVEAGKVLWIETRERERVG